MYDKNNGMATPISIFISYAHKDDSFLQELTTFLTPYERGKIISIWTDKDVVAGQKWNDVIKTRLNESEVILFLVSPDFLASGLINDNEIAAVLGKDEPVAVPIIIRHTDLSLFKMRNYWEMMPSGARPVSDWENRDKAWMDVLTKLRDVFLKVEPGVSQYLANTMVGPMPKSLSSKWRLQDMVDWVRGSLLVLIVICMAFFVYGLIKHDNFYAFTSLAGMGACFLGYMFVRRSQ